MVPHRIDMNRFAWELGELKKKEKKENPVLFYGSSTFAIWKTLEEEFKEYNAMNFGFGGSTSDEALYHYEDLVKPLKPRVLVFYNGDNEPVCGYTVSETIELYTSVFNKFKEDFPDIKIIVLATKTSPARDEYKDFVRELNAWLKNYLSDKEDMYYVETADICKTNGKYNLDAYLDDQLHFSPKSYVIIKERIERILKSVL